MTFPPEVLDILLKYYRSPEDLLGEDGILKQLTKALVERCLDAEMTTHMEERQAQESPSKPKNRLWVKKPFLPTALCATKRHSSNSGQANCESA